MKKGNLVAAVIIACACFSCNQKEKKSGEDYGTPTEESATPVAGDVIAQGESLVKASDCKTCHHATNKIIGPSHTDVAKKYEFTEANVKMLAGKIIKGGSGVWGPINMTAHADISQADAEKMARYVLSLDGEKEH
ncbi:MAG TPA: c-type cytochrome [Cyclobacteriaceae bacterium]|nr:c-type cytochrome [Cyclobacteriaceae bacterium]